MKDPITLTADIIIQWSDGSFVLVKRKNDPYKGLWALPGGMMDDDGETIEDAARREAKEETGLDVRLDRVVGVYSKPDRDPRGRYISVAYIAYPISGILESGSDAEEVMVTKDISGMTLAFDHKEIIEDYLAIMETENKKEHL